MPAILRESVCEACGQPILTARKTKCNRCYSREYRKKNDALLKAKRRLYDARPEVKAKKKAADQDRYVSNRAEILYKQRTRRYQERQLQIKYREDMNQAS